MTPVPKVRRVPPKRLVAESVVLEPSWASIDPPLLSTAPPEMIRKDPVVDLAVALLSKAGEVIGWMYAPEDPAASMRPLFTSARVPPPSWKEPRRVELLVRCWPDTLASKMLAVVL